MLNSPSGGLVVGSVTQSANSEIMARGGKARSLLSCCFGVTKKHMEVLMELLEHQRGSVLTPPRQTASYFPVPPLSQWVGGRAWGRAGCALGLPAHSSSDLRGMWYLCFVHWSDVASVPGCGNLGGCLATGRGFPAAVEDRSQRCPTVLETEERVVMGPAPLPSLCPLPTLSRLGSPLRHSTAPFGVVGTPKSLPARFPGEMWPCTASLLVQPAAAWSLPAPRRPDSPSIFLFEASSQLIHGSGFL